MISNFKRTILCTLAFIGSTLSSVAVESTSKESEIKNTLKEIQIISDSPDWNFAYERYYLPHCTYDFVNAEKSELNTNQTLNRIIFPETAIVTFDLSTFRSEFFIRYLENDQPKMGHPIYSRFWLNFEDVEKSIIDEKLTVYFNSNKISLKVNETLTRFS